MFNLSNRDGLGWDLNFFREDRAMNQANFHNEHSKWLSEHALWRDELRIWREEQREAMLASQAIEDALHKFNLEILDLERHMMDHDAQIEAHESSMVQENKIGGQAQSGEMQDLHGREIVVHEGHCAAYEHIKKKHQTFMKSMRRVNELMQQLH